MWRRTTHDSGKHYISVQMVGRLCTRQTLVTKKNTIYAKTKFIRTIPTIAWVWAMMGRGGGGSGPGEMDVAGVKPAWPGYLPSLQGHKKSMHWRILKRIFIMYVATPRARNLEGNKFNTASFKRNNTICFHPASNPDCVCLLELLHRIRNIIPISFFLAALIP